VIEILLEAERALTVGLADRAEQLYRQAYEADPRNSIAVVGLARVALERDDDAGALVLARKALGIDPENEAARRLVARLEEVLAVRGDVVPDPPAAVEAPSQAPSAQPASAQPASAPAASPAEPPPSESPDAPARSPARRRGLFGRLFGRR
jgi:tetratricopeptide (TPR) repeat protein